MDYKILSKKFEEGLKLIYEYEKKFEMWLKIKGYDNYSVSTFGRIRNDKTKKLLKNKPNGYGYYYVTLCKNGTVKNHYIHRSVANAFINNPQNKNCVDHIDKNKLNNHISNLRFATFQENSRNASKKSTNTSGYIGVSFDKSHNKYRAQYHLNNKRIHIGCYSTAIEASQAYQAKIKEHYKEFANINN